MERLRAGSPSPTKWSRLWAEAPPQQFQSSISVKPLPRVENTATVESLNSQPVEWAVQPG